MEQRVFAWLARPYEEAWVVVEVLVGGDIVLFKRSVPAEVLLLLVDEDWKVNILA